jgi:TatD DNase family protein
MLDTHAHLTSSEFATDIDRVLLRANEAGVQNVIVVSESLADAHAAIALTGRFPSSTRLALGLHPCHVTSDLVDDAACDAAVAEIAALLSSLAGQACVALGEVGLDYTPRVLSSGQKDAADAKRRQLRVFRALLRLAKDHELPVTCHSRGCGRHVVDVLEEEGMSEHAVLHAFDGRAAHAERGAANGCYFSVMPSIVRSEQMQKMVRRIRLDRLLLESDCPALGTEPGKRNEPAMVVHALKMIAALHGSGEESTRLALDFNSRALFQKVYL